VVSFTAAVAAKQSGLSISPTGTVQFNIDGTAFCSPDLRWQLRQLPDCRFRSPAQVCAAT
jgi:hypothetical protein